MSTRSICFYGHLLKNIVFNNHQIPTLSGLLKTLMKDWNETKMKSKFQFLALEMGMGAKV